MNPGDMMEAAMTLDREIEAFDAQRDVLEQHHLGKFVVIHDTVLAGAFDSLDAAAAFAVSQFGRGPYLIRQVGVPPMRLPASVLYQPVSAYASWFTDAHS